MRTTVFNDRAGKLRTAKVYVFSDSVLCLGKINEYPQKSLGKTKLSGSRSLLNMVNWIVLMENQS